MTASTGGERPVDGSFVPVAKGSVTSVELDGERVLYDVDSGRLQRLDPVGTIIWPFLDGSVSIAELADDVADAFSAPAEDVRAGIVDLVRALLDEGLLVPAGDDGTAEEPPARAAGDDAERFLVDPPGG